LSALNLKFLAERRKIFISIKFSRFLVKQVLSLKKVKNIGKVAIVEYDKIHEILKRQKKKKNTRLLNKPFSISLLLLCVEILKRKLICCSD
jgi:hypothetical protein